MAKKAAVPEVIDVPAVVTSEDEQFAIQAGRTIAEFVRQAREFFSLAKAHESIAAEALAVARGMKPPTNAAEDEAVQTFTKGTSVTKKAAVDHWETLTSTLFGWHKRSVAGRQRTVQQIEEANAIGNRLHNAYVEAARRKAAEEQERVRCAAERKAQEERQRELDRLEAEAAAKEEASADLSEREQMFITTMLMYGDGQKAAKYAGYKNPFKAATRLLSLPKIQAAIKATQEALAIRQQAAATKEQPLDVQVETVRPDISRAEGAVDRTTHGYAVVDANLFIEAFRSGRYGIPTECLQPAPKGLGELARSLHERLNTIPGLRYVKTTRTV